MLFGRSSFGGSSVLRNKRYGDLKSEQTICSIIKKYCKKIIFAQRIANLPPMKKLLPSSSAWKSRYVICFKYCKITYNQNTLRYVEYFYSRNAFIPQNHLMRSMYVMNSQKSFSLKFSFIFSFLGNSLQIHLECPFKLQ